MKTATKKSLKKAVREVKKLRTSQRDKKNAGRHYCCRCW